MRGRGRDERETGCPGEFRDHHEARGAS
jgi:hypothetical protein